MLRNLLLLIVFLILVVLQALVLLGTRRAGADEGASEGLAEGHPPEATLIEILGRPARPAAVQALVHDARNLGDPDPVLLAETLGYAGGSAALGGLHPLLTHRDLEVRVVALEALERIGLRSSRIARCVRRTVNERRGTERSAAIAALGVMGDGQDLDLLLLLADADDANTRRSAFGALRVLTGLPLPHVYARWAWQCRILRRRADAVVPDGLSRLAKLVDDPEREALLVDVGHHAWVDLARVEEQVRHWLQSSSGAHRCLACRLAGDLRLADYGRTIESTRIFAFDPELRREADRALTILGRRIPAKR